MANPVEVWKLIEKADERIKYAQNRDVQAAYGQAREALEQAKEALPGVEDVRARAGLSAQIDRRLDDLERIQDGPAEES